MLSLRLDCTATGESAASGGRIIQKATKSTREQGVRVDQVEQDVFRIGD